VPELEEKMLGQEKKRGTLVLLGGCVNNGIMQGG